MAFSGEATWYAIVAHVLHEFVYAGVQRLEQEAQNLQRAMIDRGPDWGVCPEHQGVFRQIPLRTLIQIGWTDLATTLSSWPRRPVLALRANLDATRDVGAAPVMLARGSFVVLLLLRLLLRLL